MQSLTPEQLAAFHRDGFLVIPDALSASTCDKLRARARELVAQCDLHSHRSIFTTNEQTRRLNDEYFLDSCDQIRCFFEEHAFQEDQTTLAVLLHMAINKIGHNLHNLDPVFERVSYAPEVQNILKSLHYVRPAVVQSMYIFKQPSIGGDVKPHQDGSFLYTTPQSVVGFWWALEDCTPENGCLYGVPGSHLTVPVRQKLRRTTKEQQEVNGGQLLENVPETVEPFDLSKSQPLLTKKGDLVLLHSAFVHYSNANRSLQSRHAYSIHVVESHNVDYARDNWLQPTGNAPFKPMYKS
uniref:Fe2OG dioxygenase domain-containing protein n=1 Tax=Hyaloperonospora arabidopsidis (strain Emoy2) TaxID=559515 RepID=M4C505_HYAAE